MLNINFLTFHFSKENNLDFLNHIPLNLQVSPGVIFAEFIHLKTFLNFFFFNFPILAKGKTWGEKIV